MATPAAVLSVLVVANTSQATRGLMRFNTQLGATQSSANKALGAVKTMAKGAALGAGVGIGYAVKKAADFEQQLDSLGSVSSATGRQMEQFRRQAMKAGADTKFSALDAAQAQTELAKGGLSVKNIMGGGLKAALALAAAGEMDLADAAATTANAMNLFGLKGKQSIKVADMLAEAANATTADVSDFAMALTQGGAVAKSAGLSMGQTVLALEALAKSGTKGSDAGTSLKTAMIQLIKPTAKQAELADKLGLNFISSSGKMKNMSDVSAMLRDKLSGMTKAQRTATLATLAGIDGVRTLTALYDAGPAKLDKWSKGLQKGGTAAEVAAKKQDNLKGKLENLQGSIETIAIAIGMKMLPSLTKAAEKVTDILNDPKLTASEKFSKLSKMFGEGLTAAFNKGAELATKAGPKIVSALLDGFRNLNIGAKLMVGLFAAFKLGAFARLGTQAGTAMGSSMASAAGATVGKQLPGKFSALRGRMASIGKGILGAGLMMGIADAATSGGDWQTRLGKGLSTATFGLLPPPKEMGERLKSHLDQAFAGGSPNSPGWDKFLNVLGKSLDDKGKVLVGKVVKIRRDLVTHFGNVRLKVDLDPQVAIRAGKQLDVNMNRLKNNLAGDMKSMSRISAQNMRLISQTMGLNSKSGRTAVMENMRATTGAIKTAMRSGSISSKEGMKAIHKAFVVNSRGAKDSAKTNFGLAASAIKGAVHSGQVTAKQGLKEISRLFRSYLAQFGIKGNAASSYMMSVPKSSGGGGHAPPTHGNARGGLVGFGKPGGKGRDNIPATIGAQRVLVGSGEMAAVLNRHQQAELNARTADVGGLGGFFKTYDRSHSMAKGGVVPRQIVSGPRSAMKKGVQTGLDRNRDAANRKLRAARRAKEALDAASGGDQATSTKGLVPRVKAALAFARKHGWGGQVTSGFRSEAEQVRIWNSGIRPAAKPKSLGGPGSNHSLGQAVDISDVPGFQRAMNMMPEGKRLYARVPNDPIHFSVTGHKRGGIIGLKKGGVIGGMPGIFARQVRRSGLQGRQAAVVFEAMLRANAVEAGSLGGNPRGGDSSSVGPFQMLSDKGSVAQRRNPRFAANWFIRTARGMYRKGISASLLAANVERPREDLRFKYGSSKYVPTRRILALVRQFQEGAAPKRKAKPKRMKAGKGFGGMGKGSGFTIGSTADPPRVTGSQVALGGSAKGQPFTPTRVPRGKGQSMEASHAGDAAAGETTADTSAADLAASNREIAAELRANRLQEKYLIETHGPKMLAAATVLFSGKFARAAGLGRQTPMAAGRMASL